MKAERAHGMEWDASWNTGIPIVDEQHRSLVRQVSALLDTSKEADRRVEETLDFLADYVVKHFGTEELMQKASKYPKSAEHRQMHEDFTAAFLGLRAEFDVSGDRLLMLMKITKVALNWLETHIKGADRDFGDYLRTSGLVMPPVERS